MPKVNGLRKPRPIDSDGGVEEGIVRWSGAGRFDAQDLAQQIGQRLRVGRIGVLAHRDVELPVQAEMERSTIVILGAAQVVQLVENDGLTAGHRDIPGGGKPADPVVRRRTRNRVIDVNPLVVRKIRITPSNPRSPAESVVTVRNGVDRSVPFLITRRAPPCWQTNSRPSGAKAIAVGLLMPLATTDSLNPAGSVAAEAATQPAARTAPAINASLCFAPRLSNGSVEWKLKFRL